MKVFKKLFSLISLNDRKHALLLLLMITVMAFFDLMGIASILPFMTVIINPEIIQTNFILLKFFQFSSSFGVKSSQQFIFLLGLLVLIILIFSLIFKALTNYLLSKFVQMREFSIGERLIEGYLHQPYSWFLNRNSADLGKTILSEVSTVVSGGMKPMMDLIAKGMVTIFIIIFLIATNPKMTIVICLSLSCAYFLIFYIVKNKLNKIGKDRLLNNQLRFIAVNEAFGAVKQLKVGGLEKVYVKSFSNPSFVYAKNKVSLQLISQFPSYILEALAFGGTILMILYLIAVKGNFTQSIPIISLYVFAGYRLIPATQQIYYSFTQIMSIKPSLDKLVIDIKNFKPKNYSKFFNDEINFNGSILLKNIYYKYPNSNKKVLNNINLEIKSKSRVGIVGATGSGKTTTIDIILGLLTPTKGSLEIDGIVIDNKNILSWQKKIGYVPQEIFLTDDSISSNIAFGVEKKDIRLDLVEKASKVANLHNFVKEDLPERYNTIIGEKGIRLSGGQRQRIGIARALYHNPKVLIFDEATSALDIETEKLVMSSIENISKNITVIIIAHRLDTVRNCDIIFKFNKGNLVNQGKFDEIYR